MTSFVIYEDANWFVVNKPTNLSTHGAWEGDLAVVEWLALHMQKSLFVCSRLDKGTSGVLVFAKTPLASAVAQRVHESETARKRYVFVSKGPSAGAESWVDESPIDGKHARTAFRKLAQRGAFAFYEATIVRGRTHQIRIHASRAGLPLLGDSEYGGASFSRLMLHCAETTWPRGEGTDAFLSWSAPMPPSFDALFAGADEESATLSCARDRRLSYPSLLTNAWRAIHRDEAGLPGLSGAFALDVYGEFLCLWWYGEPLLPGTPAFVLRERHAEMFRETFGALGCVVREVNRNAHKRGLVGTLAVVGKTPPKEFEVEEAGLRYVVSLTARQHVGLFLDQRDNRRRVASLVEGKRVANLFAYSCSFSAVAARAGCEVVFSVDAAESALALGKRNFAANGLVETRRGKFVAEDVRTFLERQARKRARDGDEAAFDVVVCDPPVFSSTREKGTFHVADAWKELVEGCSAITRPGGVVFFSTNHRAGEEAAYQAGLERVFPIVSRLSPPLDFPEANGHASHVKLFLCQN
jgi:23S rRNA (cytosine1962-C5)-methyltransferase